jgi:Arv1-like family
VFVFSFPTSSDPVISQCPPRSSQPSCRAPADPYVEHDAFVVALDLVLLKPEVYRHLLFNRGTPPRKVEETATPRGQDDDGLQKVLCAEEKRVAAAAAQDIAREKVRLAFFLTMRTLKS